MTLAEALGKYTRALAMKAVKRHLVMRLPSHYANDNFAPEVA